MSGDAQTNAVLRECHTATDIRLVLELRRLERRYRNATPSRAGLAERLRVCQRTITRSVRRLEDAGCLRVVRDPPHRLDDGTYTRRRTSLYRILWPRNPRSHRRDTPVTSKAPTGLAIAPAPAYVPVDNPQPGHDPPWSPRLVGLSWRDLVVRP